MLSKNSSGGSVGTARSTVGGGPNRPATTTNAGAVDSASNASNIATPSGTATGATPWRESASSTPNSSPIPTPDHTDHSKTTVRHAGCGSANPSASNRSTSLASA